MRGSSRSTWLNVGSRRRRSRRRGWILRPEDDWQTVWARVSAHHNARWKQWKMPEKDWRLNPFSVTQVPHAQRIAGKMESPETTFPLRFDKTVLFSFAIYSFLLNCCIKTLTFFTEEYPGLMVSEGWVFWSVTPLHVSLGFSKPTASHLSLLGASYLRKLKGQKAKVWDSKSVNKLSCQHEKQPKNKPYPRHRVQLCAEWPRGSPCLWLADESLSDTVHLILQILNKFG